MRGVKFWGWLLLQSLRPVVCEDLFLLRDVLHVAFCGLHLCHNSLKTIVALHLQIETNVRRGGPDRPTPSPELQPSRVVLSSDVSSCDVYGYRAQDPRFKGTVLRSRSTTDLMDVEWWQKRMTQGALDSIGLTTNHQSDLSLT